MTAALLQLERVSRRFESVVAVDEVTLEVLTGEVLGLIGPNGAGKTTLVNLISGYFPVSDGEISFDGRSTVKCRPHQLARRGIARTYQNVCLFEGSTVLENVLIGRHLAFEGKPWQLAGRRRREERTERERALEIIERLELDPHVEDDVSQLSYGIRRRVEIARALATEPSLLLLDEPTAGMTRAESDEIGRLVRSLCAQGMTVLLIDHNVRLVSEVCDRVAVLDWGRLIAIDSAEQVWADERVREAYLGSGDDR